MNKEAKVIELEKTDYSKAITEIVSYLKSNRIVILPTDTQYGIIGNYFDKNLRDRVFEIKKRDINKKFIVLVGSKNSLIDFADQNIEHAILNLLPAPLTIIIKNRYNYLYNEENIALRYPNNQFLMDILNQSQLSLIAPSANISGEEPIYELKDLIDTFGNYLDLIVYDEKLKLSASKLPSTILDITAKPYKIIREGVFEAAILRENNIDIV